MDKKPIYITTTLPYVNAKPHIGFALEVVQADAYARFCRYQGAEVTFSYGTDEYGLKIYRKAQEAGLEPQVYVDRLAESFRTLKSLLNLSSDRFIQTTNPHHKQAATEMWRRCLANGDIYKAEYKVLYCVGCELEKSLSELDNGECPIHPGQAIEEIAEENYFFRFSKYASKLLELYQSRPDFVVPAWRLKEIENFVEQGLSDFSISRLKSKMPWGVPVPDDPDHVMYVWFDALVNYLSTLGWPEPNSDYERFWPPLQFAGKDNLRQQAAMWQAMLLSAGLPLSRQIIIHGFYTAGGQKMSKSLGNVVSPEEVVAQYGTDAVRYFFLRETHPFEDSDFTMERFQETYTANLVNGLGNLTSRILKMAITHLDFAPIFPEVIWPDEYLEYYNNYDFNKAADWVWNKITELDKKIQIQKPFQLIKEDQEAGRIAIAELEVGLWEIANYLEPLLPATASEIKKLLTDHRFPDKPLFPRI
ncbi:MAG: methionine--tRNA ligase [Patescibacteria group bacterium]